MLPLLTSERWYIRLLRIIIIVLPVWWYLTQTDSGRALLALVHTSAQATDASWKTDFSKKSVGLDEIIPGGPPKDGIPAIDHPKFISVKKATGWLHPQEPVIVISRNNKARAYPLQILIFHEIVNDNFQGKPIAITFCPLCNASIVFDRTVNGKVLDFGTTGKLRKSDLVMYDRQTESWWQQFSGEAIVGRYTGTKLKKITSRIVAFSSFAKNFPQGEVLSRNTGFVSYYFKYGKNPYRGYDRVGQQPFLFHDKTDPRLPAMERVVNVTIKGKHRIYPFRYFKKSGVLHDTMYGVPLVIFHRQGVLSVLDDSIIKKSRSTASALVYRRQIDRMTLRFQFRDNRITDMQTGSEWNLFGKAVKGPLKGRQLQAVPGGNHFAFAWLAFHPRSEVYGAER